ncbi:FIST signal transduction protein [Planktothrix agardhii]|nr:FIST C-terminal domain-containing protein [Planktothrix agardhii]
MRWVSALSERPSLEAAVKEVVEIAQDALRASPDLGLVFISSAFSSEYSRLMPLLQEHLNLPMLIGCGAGGVIGMNSDYQAEEIEGEPALSLTLAHLPDVAIHPFHLSADDLPDLDSSPDQGDFLIRNLIGVDPKAGAIAIGDRVRPGQRIQFHLRDSRTSAEDLELLIERYQRQASSFPQGVTNAGALMFSCLGRGEGLYGEPNFDSRLFRRYFNIPLSGFFCNGEIGPVRDTTFLHGYTSVFGICRQKNY